MVLSVAVGILIIIFSTAAAARNTQPTEIEYHRYNKNHLREHYQDDKDDNHERNNYREEEEKDDYYEHHHKEVPKVIPPVPVPEPQSEPQPVPPIHIEPPIEIDPPLPLPGPPCGGCGFLETGIKTNNIACPMHAGASSMVCML